MINLISEIIDKFGPRPAGSEAERQAQLLVADKCKEFTDKVQILEFDEYLYARFGKLKYHCGVYFVTLLLFYFAYPKSTALLATAFAISLLNSVAFILDFMKYHVIIRGFPGPLMKSWNVEAVLDPQGEVKNTLVFGGHIDSVYEFKWWYKLKQRGAQLTVIAGILLVLIPVFYLAALLIPGEWQMWVFIAFVLLSPSLVVYFNMHGPNPVDGACDNLSGIAIAHDVVKNFADPENKGKSTLKNTRLKFVSFGSEETGLTGSTCYVKAQLKELKAEKAHLVNIDSIRVPEELCIIKSELMNGTKFDPNLISRLQKSFGDKNIFIKTGSTPIGGTDGVPFQRAGIPAVSIVGLGMGKLDPTYHTRLDVVSNLNEQALLNTKNGLVEFVKQWDAQ